MSYGLKMHHIGLATVDIEQSKAYLSEFFTIVNTSDIVYDPNQHTKLCMLTINDGTLIELVEGEIVQNYIRKRNFVYHICYLTENIEKTIENLLKKGALMISEPKEAILFDNRRVSFLMSEIGLIELLETQ